MLLMIAAAAHHEFGLGQLDDAPADIHVADADGLAHLATSGMSKRLQPARIDDDAVLLDEAADARDLGHAFRLGDAEAHLPVLVVRSSARFVSARHDDVLVDPADAGRVGPERRRDAGRQARARRIEIFEHARARPVDVGAVLEDDVDERDAEEREAAHHVRFRHATASRSSADR